MWLYRQKTGEMLYTPWEYYQYSKATTSAPTLCIGKGYSGRDFISKGASIRGRNNPDAETIKNFGPIPRGLWYIGAAENNSKLGPLALKLVADKQTQTFNRSGFFIHGDNWQHCASQGCIIQDHPVREQMDKSEDKILLVVE